MEGLLDQLRLMSTQMTKYRYLKFRFVPVLFVWLVSTCQIVFAQDDLATVPNRIYELTQAKRYGDAVTLGENSVRSADQTLPKASMLRVQIIAALADAESQSGNYAETVAVLEREIRSFESDGIRTVGLAFLYQKLADPYGFLGRNLEAEASAEHAVELYESQLAPDDPVLADALFTLSVQQRALSRTDDELHSLNRCLRILTNSKSSGSTQTLKMTLLAIADLYDAAGDSAKASDYRNKALSISTSSLGSFAIPDDYTETSEQGLAAKSRGDFATAAVLFERQLEISVLRYGEESQPAQTAREQLAFIYFEQRDRVRARPLMYKLVDSVYSDYDRYFALMTEQERLQFTTSADAKLGLFCSYVHEFHDSDQESIGKMYDLAIWSKGAVFASTRSIENRLRTSSDPELNRLRGQLEDLRQKYRTSSPATSPNTNQLRFQINSVEGEITRVLGVPKMLPYTWKDVKEHLNSDEAAIEFLRFQYEQPGKKVLYSALVMRPQWSVPKYVFLGDSEEIEQRQLHRYALYATARLEPRPPNLEFWASVEDALGSGVTRIYLSTDGELDNVSFGIIPDANGRLLIDKYDLRYLSSVRGLKVATPPKPAHSSAILVGNPDFNLSIPGSTRAVQDGTGAGISPHVWTPLPDTASQINSVRDILNQNNWNVQVFVQDTATKSLIVAGARHPRVLHFATHGYFPEDAGSSGQIVSSLTDIAMLKSGLVLAGANSPAAKPGDALLSSYEISSLDLSGTELVVLSACDTGLGDTLSGGEIFGLRRAFQIAGAQTLLMTMWNVPSIETTDLLVEKFYSNWLAGADIHDALRAAQASVRSQAKQPYFWGAFVIIE